MPTLNDKAFATEINGQLANGYVLSSDEPLLVAEARDALIARAREQGFSDRKLFSVEANFDWNGPIESCQSMSLFDGATIVDIRLHDFKLGSQGPKALQHISQTLSPDTLLIISTPRIGPKERRAAWYKAVDTVAQCVSFWPPDNAQFPRWLSQRCQQAKLTIEPNALTVLAERVAGNLLAAHQEITKLATLHPNDSITAEIIEDCVAPQARFDTFALNRVILEGQSTAILHTLTVLEDTGETPILVLWTVTQLIRQLKKAVTLHGEGTAPKQACLSSGLKGPLPYQKACERALRHFTVEALNGALVKCAEIDREIKTSSLNTAWSRLQQLCLRLGKMAVRERRAVV